MSAIDTSCTIPMTEEDAKVCVLKLEMSVRSVVSKSLPNDQEPRYWAALSWNERLALCNAFVANADSLEAITQNYNRRMQLAEADIKNSSVKLEGRRGPSEIRAEGMCLVYSAVYQTIVRQNTAGFEDMKWTERLLALQNADTVELRALERNFIEQRVKEEDEAGRSKAVEEAAAAYALVQSGRSFDCGGIFHSVPATFPNFQKYCALGPIEQYSNYVEHTKEEIHRLLLHHMSFGDMVIEFISYSSAEMFQWGQSGGCTKCRIITKQELTSLPALETLRHLGCS